MGKTCVASTAPFALIVAALLGHSLTGCGSTDFEGGRQSAKASGDARDDNDGSDQEDPDDDQPSGRIGIDANGQIADLGPQTDSGDGVIISDPEERVTPVSIATDAGSVTFRRICHIAVAWNNNIGETGAYSLGSIKGLPPIIRVRKLDLFHNPLTAADLDGLDLFVFGDSWVTRDSAGANFEVDGLRPLDAGEQQLIRDAFARKVGFLFAADNGLDAGGYGDASAGTRLLVPILTPLLGVSPVWTGEPEPHATYPADEVKYPFLKGVTWDFSNIGVDSPTHINRVTAPAECLLNPSGQCRLAWLPPDNEHGFLFINGNAGNGSGAYILRLMEKRCGDAAMAGP